MWKYNKYQLGEIVIHTNVSILEFQVYDIYPGVPEERDNYLYCCKLLMGRIEDIGKIYKYQENDLTSMRAGTKEELSALLTESINKGDYERASQIQKLIG